MVDSHIYRWADGRLVDVEWCDPHAGRVIAADSWLVVDGYAVAVDRHLERFARTLANQFPDLDIPRFASDALATIPETGRWFPRLEAVDYGEGVALQARVRPAPDPQTQVVVATATRDPRTQPTVKGPDLASLGALRTELNVGEAIILDDGHVAEGAWSSVVWWANDQLHVVDPAISRLASVTESVIRDHATYIGAPVHHARVTPDDLNGVEMWVLSSLHGIRVVTEWQGGPILSVEPGRADYWRQQYTNQRRVMSET